MKKSYIYVPSILVVGAFGYYVCKRVINGIIFQPPMATYNSKNIKFAKTKNGNKIAIYALKSRKNLKTTTLIYSHGNACDVGVVKNHMNVIHNLIPNINVIAYDYIGYGLSTKKKITEKTCYESLDSVITYCKDEFNIQNRDIILYGYSVGSGSAVEFASRYSDFGGLFLESPLASCLRVLYSGMVSPFLDYTFDIFVNVKKINKVKCPVMIFHGERDRVIPVRNSRELWKNVPKNLKFKKVIVPEAGHHNLVQYFTYKKYLSTLNSFIQHCKNRKFKEEEL